MELKSLFKRWRTPQPEFVNITRKPSQRSVETKAENQAQRSLLNPFGEGLAVRETRPDIWKAYVPEYLYAPPYGTPRKVDLQRLKTLAKNPFIFSVIKTLCDEACSVPWKIQIKKEFQDDGNDYKDKINEITKFFRNPNGNEESFEYVLRAVLTDILELDSGVIVKVFNWMGELKHIVARSGDTFLKHPDIYGYLGDRAAFVAPLTNEMATTVVHYASPNPAQQRVMNAYDVAYKNNAAYFQYGWTAGSMPVPFGLREVIYILQNPRGDSIYGRSALEILDEVVQVLVYGIQMHLDFFTNNQMPEGVIQLLGANKGQISNFRQNFNTQFKFEDNLGSDRKRFYSFPIASQEVKFTPFQLTTKDMEILAGQEWWTKIVWMCFGVTPTEMGQTDNSNKSVDQNQDKITKRKAIKPILKNFEYHLNTQLMPEFFLATDEDTGANVPMNFADVPLEFIFDLYDIDEDMKTLNLNKLEIDMGIKTSLMVAKERGIDVDELKAEIEERDKKELDNELTKIGAQGKFNKQPEQKLGVEKKSKIKKSSTKIDKEGRNILTQIDDYIDGIGDRLTDAVEKENGLSTIR